MKTEEEIKVQNTRDRTIFHQGELSGRMKVRSKIENVIKTFDFSSYMEVIDDKFFEVDKDKMVMDIRKELIKELEEK